jgi:hypothetical protein
VAVDATGRTSISGVWAAGNAVNPRAQVITAAAEGSAAAIAINNDLADEDLPIAVTTSGSASPSEFHPAHRQPVRRRPSAHLPQPISPTKELTMPNAHHTLSPTRRLQQVRSHRSPRVRRPSISSP